MYSHSSYSYSAHSSPIKYREDIECIVNPVNDIGGIYVGNLEAAENLNTLKQLNIKAMLTAAVGVYISHPKTHVNSTKYVPA
jgi:dual specificity phosphatase 12